MEASLKPSLGQRPYGCPGSKADVAMGKNGHPWFGTKGWGKVSWVPSSLLPTLLRWFKMVGHYPKNNGVMDPFLKGQKETPGTSFSCKGSYVLSPRARSRSGSAPRLSVDFCDADLRRALGASSSTPKMCPGSPGAIASSQERCHPKTSDSG